MVQPHREEFVTTTTEDGLLLEGALLRPVAAPARPLALVWIHGALAHYSSPPYIAIGRALAARGYPFVSGDTRGRDAGAVLWGPSGPRQHPDADQRPFELGGLMWERLDEAPHDLAAWVGFAAGLGVQSVVLIGHSFGAQKVVYYQAERQDPRVRGLVAASGGRATVAPELVAGAQRMVAAGRGRDLLPWGTSYGNLAVSAQTWASRAATGHLEVFGYGGTPTPAIGRVRCPVLAFYGTEEAWLATAADLETIKANARQAARVDTRLLEGVDHGYNGHTEAVAACIAEWVASLGAAPVG
jgi:dienelactone hydrolase